MTEYDTSIVIPTYNDEDTLEACLDSLESLDYVGTYNTIIVDGHSNDRTVEIAETYGCDVIFEDKGTISYARELGVKASNSEFIAFTDADCVVPDDWLSTLISHFDDHGEVAAVGGPNITPPDDTSFAKSVGDVLSLLSGAGARYGFEGEETREIYHNPTCNVVYRREVIEEVGGFNHDLITVDDEEMDYRIREKGYTILYTPEAEVLHYRRPSWKSYTKMGYRYGIGRAQATKLHPEMGEWFHFAPSSIILLLASFLAGSVKSRSWLKVLAGTLSLGSLGIISMSVYLSEKRNRWTQLPVYAILISIWFWAWGIGFIKGLLRH
ncbi:glycosyltransferase [Natrinema gari]|uniref:Dolichyl-phosphate mannose synthase-like protein n=1 Tax=Natrinema gari JCM 14663 TaxID=1230459 RepID=L9YVR6_9EURY|nr:glycosyltransferase [Natrinema gari]ELY77552.1 dolichyl-phosphate mannose synthase-like protein [Natrinema gari JCM 14663]